MKKKISFTSLAASHVICKAGERKGERSVAKNDINMG